MTTQHELVGSDLLAAKIPILRETSLLIADPQVRYVGTLGGNVANGDPGNDMPAVMLCLGATYHVAGKGGERRIAAREFYQGAYFTALEPGEILTADPHSGAVGRPRLRLREAQAQDRRLRDRRRRRGADAWAAAEVATCSIGLTNVAETPLWAEEAANILVGSRARRRDRQAGGRRRRSDHLARLRPARPRPIPHQDGGRDAGARARARQGARPAPAGETSWPKPRYP